MKTIGIRDLLRGGYKDITEPVMVMSHNRPVAIWRPTTELAEGSAALTSYFYPSSISNTATNSLGSATAMEEWGASALTEKKFRKR